MDLLIADVAAADLDLDAVLFVQLGVVGRALGIELVGKAQGRLFGHLAIRGAHLNLDGEGAGVRLHLGVGQQLVGIHVQLLACDDVGSHLGRLQVGGEVAHEVFGRIAQPPVRAGRHGAHFHRSLEELLLQVAHAKGQRGGQPHCNQDDPTALADNAPVFL